MTGRQLHERLNYHEAKRIAEVNDVEQLTPTWDELTPAEQEAWDALAEEVVQGTLR